MAYSVALDVKNEYPDVLLLHLTDDANSGSVIDAEITRAIAWGEDLYINPYCQDNYTLPFSTVPNQVKQWSMALAWHRLHQRYGDSNKTKKTFEDIIAQLEKVRKGAVTIYGATTKDRDYYVTYEPKTMPDIGLDDMLDVTFEENEDD